MEPIIFITVIVFTYIGVRIYKNNQYKKTAYYQATKKPYSSLDAGEYGEYLTYKQLQNIENLGGKFIFNAYIPKPNNKTTEIDVLLISPKGIFVFESKNYNGWIFRHQQQEYWTQTLPTGRGRSSHKIKFYNPIWQNAGHKKHLERIIEQKVYIHSIIVFSDECTLRDITITTDDVNVLYQSNLKSSLSDVYKYIEVDVLSQDEINNIYDKLYPYT